MNAASRDNSERYVPEQDNPLVWRSKYPGDVPPERFNSSTNPKVKETITYTNRNGREQKLTMQELEEMFPAKVEAIRAASKKMQDELSNVKDLAAQTSEFGSVKVHVTNR
jgi:hypothetical protein